MLCTEADVDRVLRECHNNSAPEGQGEHRQNFTSLLWYWSTMTLDINEG